MSLLNDASLILVPSAIKTGEVLVQKPLPNKFADETGNYDGNDPQGSANLTFTRASNASRVNSDGLVERVRSNSLLQSNSFDTTWINANSTNTSGQSGYDGSSDAWLLSKTGASGRITQTISVSGIFTFSVYVKKGTTDWVLLYKTGTGEGGRYFDLTNGVIGSSVATAPIDSKIEQVGTSDWYRCSIVGNSATAVVIYVADSNGSASGTSGNIYIQNAQLEQGDIATNYISTTASARSTFAGITVDGTSVPNVPRLDYSGGATCPSLLLEPQRTNLATYSEYIGSWAQSDLVGTDNFAVSPEGVQNAAKISASLTSATHFIQLIGTSVGSDATISVFAKADTGSYIQLTNPYSGANFANFDVATGVVGTKGANCTSSSIEDYGNGWYRCTAVFNFVGTSHTYRHHIISSASAPFGQSWLPSSDTSLFVYGHQWEAGSYVTSYIPTYGTSATRLADSCSKTGISSLIGQTEGTLFVEVNQFGGQANSPYLLASDGTLNNRIQISSGGGGTENSFTFYISVGGVNNVFYISPTGYTGVHKLAIAYKLNDVVGYIDGVQVLNDTSSTIPATTTLEIGRIPSNPVNAGINQALLFKTRLSNAQLAELTTL